MRVYMILCRAEGDMSFTPKFTDDPSLVKDLLKKNETLGYDGSLCQTPKKMEIVVFFGDLGRALI